MHPSSPRAPRSVPVLFTCLAAALAALGAAWALSRSQAGETPRWDEDAFIALHEAPGAPPAR